MAVVTIKDTPEEIVMAILPGAEGRTEMDYAKYGSKRRWDFIDTDWQLSPFVWRAQRALVLVEPNKFYSIRLFWREDTGKFQGYYVNFQLPYQRSHCGVDTLDLELDIVVHPDFSFEWKDLDDYRQGLETGIILPEWATAIEAAKKEILDKVAKRLYPFDGSWLDWIPEVTWAHPQLPENWDIV
jgi:protein associated with RNAse G/E